MNHPGSAWGCVDPDCVYCKAILTGSALSQVTGAVATVKQTTKGDNNE